MRRTTLVIGIFAILVMLIAIPAFAAESPPGMNIMPYTNIDHSTSSTIAGSGQSPGICDFALRQLPELTNTLSETRPAEEQSYTSTSYGTRHLVQTGRSGIRCHASISGFA